MVKGAVGSRPASGLNSDAKIRLRIEALTVETPHHWRNMCSGLQRKARSLNGIDRLARLKPYRISFAVRTHKSRNTAKIHGHAAAAGAAQRRRFKSILDDPRPQ